MLLPVDCAACGARGPSPCSGCLERLRPAPTLATPPGLDRFSALLAYEGVGRELVARLKYRNQRAALGGLGRAAAALIVVAPDVVTWAPTSAARRGHRGYDQAELLARVVGRALGRPVRRLLVRLPGRPQTGRDAADRWSGPAYRLASTPFGGGRTRIAGRTVLVVDDVVTTGATMAAAAAALRPTGARVHGLAVARTPAHPRRPAPAGAVAE
jgi:predicted amidophosphoribosyltransferase